MKQVQDKSIYGVIAVCCFGIVILQPLWYSNADTITASILTIIGWVTATLGYKK